MNGNGAPSIVVAGGGPLVNTGGCTNVTAELVAPAVLSWMKMSVTAPVPIDAMTVPSAAMPLTATLYDDGPPVTTAGVAPAVPDRMMSDAVRPCTAAAPKLLENDSV